MAPVKPRNRTAGENPGRFFGGAVSFEYITPPAGRSFAIRAIFAPNTGEPPPPPPPSDSPTPSESGSNNAKRRSKKPKKTKAPKPFPKLHFHPFQLEYFYVESGSFTIHEEGTQYILLPETPEHTVPANAIHWVEATEGAPTGCTVVASADGEGAPYQLDRTFFENWMWYQSEGFTYGYGASMIQVHSMWDAGDCVLPLPKWIPFSKKLAFWRGVVVGRWIGGALGYQPFYEEWTTDWDAACTRMEKCVFQKRFIKRGPKAAVTAIAIEEGMSEKA